MLKGKQVVPYHLLLFSTKPIICAPHIMAHPHVSIYVLPNSKREKKIRRGSVFKRKL